LDEPTPIAINAAAAITDLSNQVMETSQTITIHPSSLYVGLRAPKPYGEVNQAFKLDVLCCGIDGKLKSDQKVTITASAESWAYVVDEETKIGTYKQVHDTQHYDMITEHKDEKTSSSLPHTVFSFTPKLGGSYTYAFVSHSSLITYLLLFLVSSCLSQDQSYRDR
jgi:hypothetical protein